MGSGSQIYATPTTYQQGQIATNGNSLSFALAGPGFFAIRNPQNNTTSYTRNGDFLRSGTGLLVTAAGDEVLDQAGNPITLPPIGHIEVDAKGVINVNGVVGDQIGTYEFTNLQALEAQGTGTYTAPAAAGVRPAQNTTVIQYAEEKSNADVITSIVGLISNERWFDANEKSISTQDDATNQAISIVGKSS
jgi:flagellar basal-body rod protein FlgG